MYFVQIVCKPVDSVPSLLLLLILNQSNYPLHLTNRKGGRAGEGDTREAAS